MRVIRRGQVCAEIGCGAEVKARGLCNRHYHVYANEKRKKPCGCGCGELTAYTYKHGHHTRLFSGEEQARRGRQNTGDKLRDPAGATSYRKRNQRHEHRTVMENKIGRPLTSADIVHHVNGDPRDNRPENLMLTTRAGHMEEHRQDLIEGRRRASSI